MLTVSKQSEIIRIAIVHFHFDTLLCECIFSYLDLEAKKIYCLILKSNNEKNTYFSRSMTWQILIIFCLKKQFGDFNSFSNFSVYFFSEADDIWLETMWPKWNIQLNQTWNKMRLRSQIQSVLLAKNMEDPLKKIRKNQLFFECFFSKKKTKIIQKIQQKMYFRQIIGISNYLHSGNKLRTGFFL